MTASLTSYSKSLHFAIKWFIPNEPAKQRFPFCIIETLLDLIVDMSLTVLLSLAQWYSRTVWILEKPWTSAERWNARSKLCVLNGNGPLQCPAHLRCKLLFEQRCTCWRYLSLKQLVRLFSAPDITLRFNQGLPQVPRPSLETSQARSFFVNCLLWCFKGP